MNDQRIAIIGCGNLGQAIAHGLIASGTVAAANITATRRNLRSLAALAELGVQVTSDNRNAVAGADMVILAVKPFNVAPMLQEIGPLLDPSRQMLISLATGITLAQMAAHVPKGLPMFRAMPNTAADVGESVTAICGVDATQQQRGQVTALFDTIGMSLIIDESLMESATILGACGIAYALRFIRAMIQGGIEVGFDAATATAIVSQTVKGAAQLLIQKGGHPEQEIDKVTTPKGCTIVGLNEMEHAGFSSALIKGIVTSYEKIAK
ncbi:MAG: pyrroline-5-carboxylate reductase [Flavobacteriales bacterium]|nr:pyrroline-5-carboxylate reductase [Flavobacteriales bacterium]